MAHINPPINSEKILLFLAALPIIAFLGPFLIALSFGLFPALTTTLDNTTDAFFYLISPNPVACFLVAHLLLLTLSAFVVDPNHVGRMLHPERYYNGRSLRYRLFYVLAAPLGFATFSVVDAWKHRDSNSKKEDFWVEVVKHVVKAESQQRQTTKQTPRIYHLTLKPTIASTRPENAISEEGTHRLRRMVVISEGQALLFFHILSVFYYQLPVTALLLLLPLAIKLLAYVARPERHGVYYTGRSVIGAKQAHTKAYHDIDPGTVVLEGDESLVRQFAKSGTFGKEKHTPLTSPIQRYAQTTAILAASLLHLSTLSVFLVSTDWQSDDIVPWVWTLQQATALFAASIFRMSGYADLGRTEQRLGSVLAKGGKVILWGGDNLGVEVMLGVDDAASQPSDDPIAKVKEATRLREAALAQVDTASVSPCCDVCDTGDLDVATAGSNLVPARLTTSPVSTIQELKEKLAGRYEVRFKTASSDQDEESDGKVGSDAAAKTQASPSKE